MTDTQAPDTTDIMNARIGGTDLHGRVIGSPIPMKDEAQEVERLRTQIQEMAPFQSGWENPDVTIVALEGEVQRLRTALEGYQRTFNSIRVLAEQHAGLTTACSCTQWDIVGQWCREELAVLESSSVTEGGAA